MPEQVQQSAALPGLPVHPGAGDGRLIRERVLDEACSWLGTPYHHRGTIKGAGVDCAQFPMLVYSACGLFPPFDTGDYPPDWHLHSSEERYLETAQRLAHEITEDQAGPGDFVLFRVGHCFAHGAIIVAWPTIIHAVLNACVTEGSALYGRMGAAPRKFFTPW